jgi:hypothetical protein
MADVDYATKDLRGPNFHSMDGAALVLKAILPGLAQGLQFSVFICMGPVGVRAQFKARPAPRLARFSHY